MKNNSSTYKKKKKEMSVKTYNKAIVNESPFVVLLQINGCEDRRNALFVKMHRYFVSNKYYAIYKMMNLQMTH